MGWEILGNLVKGGTSRCFLQREKIVSQTLGFSKPIFPLIAGNTCYSRIKIGKITGMVAATALQVPLGLIALDGDKYLSYSKLIGQQNLIP